MTQRTRILVLVTTITISTDVVSSAPALAVDGVIEINQSRALAGGVTPGDAPGFPVTISQPGSYRLTGSLDVTAEPTPENATAIAITSSFVTLDLNGFALAGPTVCTGSPVTSCAPLGSGRGVDSQGTNMVRIRNGSVRGFGAEGLKTGNASVESVDAFGNGANGVWLLWGGSVADSTATGNGADGIAGPGVLVERCRALSNKLSGIYLYPGTLRGSEAVGNGAYGMSAGSGVAFENVSRGNAGCAIEAPGGAYGRNVVSGSVTLCGGVELGQNLCNGSATCP